MFSSKNILCLDLEVGNSITAAEQFNISIISSNLADFNLRFETEIVLHYSSNTGEFEPMDAEDLLAGWFCDGIKELLALANSKANHSKEQIDRYLSNRRMEVEHLKISSTFSSYCKRYHNYSPLGFLSYDNEQYVKKGNEQPSYITKAPQCMKAAISY